jgi:hypothetical protein
MYSVFVTWTFLWLSANIIDSMILRDWEGLCHIHWMRTFVSGLYLFVQTNGSGTMIMPLSPVGLETKSVLALPCLIFRSCRKPLEITRINPLAGLVLPSSKPLVNPYYRPWALQLTISGTCHFKMPSYQCHRQIFQRFVFSQYAFA